MKRRCMSCLDREYYGDDEDKTEMVRHIEEQHPEEALYYQQVLIDDVFELFEVQILIDELQRSISSLGESDDESDIAYMEELERIREKLKKEARQ